MTNKEKNDNRWIIRDFVNKLLLNFGFKIMPIMNYDYYVYRDGGLKTEYQYSIDISNEVSLGDAYVYGYIIETRRTNYPSHYPKEYRYRWSNHSNHKILKTKESALESINQFKRSSYYDNEEFRILPMYSFKGSAYRTYLINKIIEDK